MEFFEAYCIFGAGFIRDRKMGSNKLRVVSKLAWINCRLGRESSGLCDFWYFSHKIIYGWWFGTMEFYDFPIILGMSSGPSWLISLYIFQRGWVGQATRYTTWHGSWDWSKGWWIIQQQMFPEYVYIIHRIGWWENLHESPIFDGKNYGFL